MENFDLDIEIDIQHIKTELDQDECDSENIYTNNNISDSILNENSTIFNIITEEIDIKTEVITDDSNSQTCFNDSSNIDRTSWYQCDFCNKIFRVKQYIINHLRIHTNERPYRCEICHKGFKEKGAHNRHFKLHIVKEQHLCDICNKHFTRIEYLNNHKMRKHKLYFKPLDSFIKCEVCDKVFVYKVHYNEHMHSHRDKRPHKCNVCEKRFKTEVCLRSHLTIHDTAKYFKCQICDKVFRSSWHLKDHGKVHQPKIKCEVCYKTFRQSSFDAHKKRHGGKKVKVEKEF